MIQNEYPVSGSNSGASTALENGNLLMRENFVMMSAYSRTPVRRYYLAGRYEVDSAGVGTGNHAACVCLSKTLTSSPRGSQWSFSSKDIEFPLFELRQKKL